MPITRRLYNSFSMVAMLYYLIKFYINVRRRIFYEALKDFNLIDKNLPTIVKIAAAS